MAPITLTTDRLTLRPHVPADLEDSAAMWAEEAVARGTGRDPLPREQVWSRLLGHVGHWSVVGYGFFVVRDRTGRFLGEVGLMDSRRATEPSFEGTPEAGWAFAAAAHGAGYAREALAAVLAWADGRGMARTVAIIAPDNIRSIRLAERLGYHPAGEVGRAAGGPIGLWERRA